MNWNEYRTDYVKRHGKTSIQELSENYAKYRKSAITKKSPRKSPKPLNIKKMIASTPKSRNYKIEKAKSLKIGEARGSRTRGWDLASPQRGTERSTLLKTCGERAFLLPEEKKFPVMPALRVSNKCEYSCQGIQSAKQRACAYNYLDVAEKAQKLGEKHCGFEHKSPCRKRLAPGPM